MDGSRVEEMILAGQIDEVARYCESDVVNNYRVWLMYELFRALQPSSAVLIESRKASRRLRYDT